MAVQVEARGADTVAVTGSVAPGDRITVRGLGRARIVALGGISRKGRQFVRYARSV